MQTLASLVAMRLQYADSWALTAPCRHHGSSHTNGECKLQQGLQQGCKEARYAAAFTAAGLLFGLDEQYNAYSSAFSATRRDIITNSSSKSGGILQQTAATLNCASSRLLLSIGGVLGQGMSEGIGGSCTRVGDLTSVGANTSGTCAIPSSKRLPVLTIGNGRDAAANAVLQQACD